MYYYVGGMPEAVLAFTERRDFDEVREIQHEILKSYDYDFSKHAPAEIVPRIRQVWNSLPVQLSQENASLSMGLSKRERGQGCMKQLFLRARSLRQFVGDYSPMEAYRLSMSNYRKESWMTNIPLYALEAL